MKKYLIAMFILPLIIIFIIVKPIELVAGDLDKSAIVNDATIIPEFWTDLYDALTGDSTYNNVFGGNMSFHGNNVDSIGTIFTIGGTGDIDGNGQITTVDKNDYLLPYLKGDFTFTAEQYKTADLNGDGYVNFWDLLLITELNGKSVPYSDSTKFAVFASVQSKMYANSSSHLIFNFTIVDFGTNYLVKINTITSETVNWGKVYQLPHASIDSLEAYRLQHFAEGLDSVTTVTDTIFLWKNGKRATLIFETP